MLCFKVLVVKKSSCLKHLQNTEQFLFEKASEKTCYLGRSCGMLYNAQLILHRYQSLRNIITLHYFFNYNVNNS